MKKLLTATIPLCALVCLAAMQPPGPTGEIKILVENVNLSSTSTDSVFRIYASPDATLPLSNWPLLTNLTMTNLASTERITNAFVTPPFVWTNATFVITSKIVPGQMFFTGDHSNWWGRSDFYAVISTPTLPGSDARLGITRGR